LFFIDPDGRLMVVDTDTTGAFHVGTPQELFTVRLRPGFTGSQYGVSRDGQRFLVNQLDIQASETSFTVLVNWLARLSRGGR
jgi:hypothetical protein